MKHHCQKKRYRTAWLAEATMQTIHKGQPRDKMPVRKYLCPLCNFWHLTSRPGWQEYDTKEVTPEMINERLKQLTKKCK